MINSLWKVVMKIPGTTKVRAFTSDDIGDFFGYVYLITNKSTGKKYIGRKYFMQKRKPKGGKRRVTSESDWKKYYGSSQNSKPTYPDMERTTSPERSYPSTKPWER